MMAMKKNGTRQQILTGKHADVSSSGVHERRASPRTLPPVGLGRPTLGLSVGRTEDFSMGGLRVNAVIGLGVGDSVPVKFAGMPAIGARIAWKRGALLGLAVPAARLQPAN
jgi:hypothetical protein